MATIVFEITADEAKAFRAFQKLIDQQAGLEKGLNKSMSASQKLEAAAKRMLESTATPAERYKKQLAEINELSAKGKISEETRARAIANVTAEYKKASQGGLAAFGKEQLANLASYAMGFASITTAISLSINAIKEFRAEQEKAGQARRSSKEALGQLAQLASTPEEFDKLQKMGEKAFASGGFGTNDQGLAAAYQFTFDAKSAGIEDQIDNLIKIKSTGLIKEVGPLAAAMGTLESSFGKSDFNTRISRGLAAAGPAPGSTQDILIAASKAGATASRLGFSEEEVMAATGLTARATGSADEAGTALRALMTTIEKGKAGNVKGKTLVQVIEQLQGMMKNGANPNMILGEERAVSAYAALSKNLDAFKAGVADVKGQGERNTVQEKIQMLDSNLAVLTASMAEQADATKFLHSVNKFGTAENLAQSVESRMKDESTDMVGGGWMQRRKIDFNRMGSAGSFLGGALGYQRGPAAMNADERVAALLMMSDQNNQGGASIIESMFPAERRNLAQQAGFSADETKAFVESGRLLNDAAKDLKAFAASLRSPPASPYLKTEQGAP